MLRWLAVCIVAGLVIGSQGCVWRTETAEHHFGPVLFRYSEPPERDAYITEQQYFAFSIEGGRQWGLSLGWKTRVAVSAHEITANPSGQQASSFWQWSAPLSPFGDPVKGRYFLSLFYLRGEQVPKPDFLMHTLYGAQVAVGVEETGLTVGVSRVTEMAPSEDGIYVFQFDSSRPLETQLKVWRGKDAQAVPAHLLLQEVKP